MLYILLTDFEILTWYRSILLRQATQKPFAHKLIDIPEWTHIREGVRKRPQHQCKVCSIRKRKVGQRSATRFFCETCSDRNKRYVQNVWLLHVLVNENLYMSCSAQHDLPSNLAYEVEER
ncbi:LOW QUALITY PROTEIN: hypothetical protein PHMEG_00032307 [Phytophthora megakarya]|uniref:PiggyBac transposable element-derived protein domain-containing protein n=1 Tax=Phytophthora megakarya TaxID=4795 RepID=A0A225UW81_9STRA|nr:LOW QUALITY PROTEIN: hypothetical protein PHMEG_00032307 [Phytophthora megakarya]